MLIVSDDIRAERRAGRRDAADASRVMRAAGCDEHQMCAQHTEAIMAYPATGPRVRDGGGAPARSRGRQMLAAMLGVGLLFLLIGLGLVISSTLSISAKAQLRADGHAIVADVLDAQVARSTRRGSVTSTRYEVKYRFQPPGQAVVTSGWEEAPEDVVRKATQTGQIEVRYLPSDPNVNLPSASVGDEAASGLPSSWRIVVGAGFALLGLGITVLALKRPQTPRPSRGLPIVLNPAG